MAARVYREVAALHAASTRIKVVAQPEADRRISSWLGGSILGSLSSFHDMWMSKAVRVVYLRLRGPSLSCAAAGMSLSALIPNTTHSGGALTLCTPSPRRPFAKHVYPSVYPLLAPARARWMFGWMDGRMDGWMDGHGWTWMDMDG